MGKEKGGVSNENKKKTKREKLIITRVDQQTSSRVSTNKFPSTSVKPAGNVCGCDHEHIIIVRFSILHRRRWETEPHLGLISITSQQGERRLMTGTEGHDQRSERRLSKSKSLTILEEGF
jgi:hypothetical protein